MSVNLVMNFPILQSGRADFMAGVGYEVEAKQSNGKMTITHTLSGQSYISDFIKNGKARFSVQLLYRDSSERRHYPCETTDIQYSLNKIIAEQIITFTIPYAPEISPYIVPIYDVDIAPTNKASGVSAFWHHIGTIYIPMYSRIALHSKLTFSGGGAFSPFQIELMEDYDDGIMKVEVNEYVTEREVPVTLLCGKDIYDLLRTVKTTELNALPESRSANESLAYAIITNAFCALYAYMQKLCEVNRASKEYEYEEGGVLLDHLNMLKDKIETSWQDENFNPSLSATKILPYMLGAKILNDESEDD